NYLGIVSLVRVMHGSVKKGDKILVKSTGRDHVVDSVGVFTPKRTETGILQAGEVGFIVRSEEHTSELQSRENLVCGLLLEKKRHHMISVRSLRSDVKDPTGSVMIATGDRIRIERIRNLMLIEKNSAAFYLPQFTPNQRSVKRATVTLDCQVGCRPNELEFPDLKTVQVIGRGHIKNELCHLQPSIFHDPATTEIYTLSLPDALPI